MDTNRTKHTPGPWVGFVADSAVVCILPAGRPGEICAFEDTHYPSDADANLMIAAPDMLTALEATTKNMRTLWEIYTATDPKLAELMRFNCEANERTIAKARGTDTRA